MFPLAIDEYKILDGVLLTAAYTGNTSAAHEVRSYGSFTIVPVYAAHASSPSAKAQIQVQFSPDGTNWGTSGTWGDSGSGQETFTADTYNVDQNNPKPQITMSNLSRWMRIKAQETGYTASNFGTVSVYIYSTVI